MDWLHNRYRIGRIGAAVPAARVQVTSMVRRFNSDETMPVHVTDVGILDVEKKDGRRSATVLHSPLKGQLLNASLACHELRGKQGGKQRRRERRQPGWGY